MTNVDRVYFARNGGGQLVDVQQVSRGLACACRCVACGGPLVAKQGTKVTWHFAHAQPSHLRSCGETALHIAAKDALTRLATIEVPAASFSLPSLRDSVGRELTVQASAPRQDAAVITAELEAQRDGPAGAVRLDGLLATKLGAIGIEIRVTHAVDDVKTAKLAALNLPVVEIDLSTFVEKCASLADLESIVQHKAPRRLVSGAEVIFAGHAHDALRRAEEKLASIEAAIARHKAITLEDRQREIGLARAAGVNPASPPAAVGSLQWLADRESDDVPARPFGGTHHRLWQLALMAWLTQQRNHSKLSFSAMLTGTYEMLGVPEDSQDVSSSATALNAWLGQLDWPGYELRYLYNDDHGWGEDWFQWRRAENSSVRREPNQPPRDDDQLALW